MIYTYECRNKKCICYTEKKEISVMKSMSDSSREEKCPDCNEIVHRVFQATPHQTFGDGYKG